METEAYTARVMYAPDGKTRRVDTLQLQTALEEQGWAFSPFPPPPEAPKRPSGIMGQLEDLHDRVLVIEAILLKRKGGRPPKGDE